MARQALPSPPGHAGPKKADPGPGRECRTELHKGRVAIGKVFLHEKLRYLKKYAPNRETAVITDYCVGMFSGDSNRNLTVEPSPE